MRDFGAHLCITISSPRSLNFLRTAEIALKAIHGCSLVILLRIESIVTHTNIYGYV